MYENIITIHNVLKKKITQLNFQPAQYLKKLAKIILKQKNFKKKEKKRRRNQFWVKKKSKKKTCTKKKQKQKKKKHNFFKKYMGKHCSKTKTMQGKHCSNPYCFFFKKKTTKLNSQPT